MLELVISFSVGLYITDLQIKLINYMLMVLVSSFHTFRSVIIALNLTKAITICYKQQVTLFWQMYVYIFHSLWRASLHFKFSLCTGFFLQGFTYTFLLCNASFVEQQSPLRQALLMRYTRATKVFQKLLFSL